ncbi:MAG: hypothetical protein SNJ70_10505 [Armatimonadota bacterium]
MIDLINIKEKANVSASKLWQNIVDNHLKVDGSIMGPDGGGRWNLRVWRFVRSYLPFLPWRNNDRYLLQGQGYWILANYELYNQTRDKKYYEAVTKCADSILKNQTDEGYWVHDAPGWEGRITTVEGCFAAIGLLRAFDLSKDKKYLDGAVKWYDYMMENIGFQKYNNDENSLSLRYYSNNFASKLVPNVSTLGLWISSEMHKATNDDTYLQYNTQMINFLIQCQLHTGELPYAIGKVGEKTRTHYLCYQYHAFELMDLLEYYKNTNDERIIDVIKKVAEYLKNGVRENGDARFACHKKTPTVPYYTAAVSAALLMTTNMGFGNYIEQSLKGYNRLIEVQRKDGGYDYSWNNYLIFKDKNSYPRNLAMILYHLTILMAKGE